MNKPLLDNLTRFSYKSLPFFLGFTTILVSSIVLFILFFLALEAAPVLNIGMLKNLFLHKEWYPLESIYGFLPILLGSLLVAVGAVVIAFPLGVFTAFFIRFFCPPWLSKLTSTLMEILAGIPSVVFGLWGLVQLVPWIQTIQSPGTSLLSASVVLSLMVLPTITLVIGSHLQNIPKSVYKNAMALGMSKEHTVKHIIWPMTLPAVGVGIVLSFGRAIGETMAVLMVAGNVVQIPGSVFDSVRTLTSNIALEMAYAMNEHRAALFFGGLLLGLSLFIMTFFIHSKVHLTSPIRRTH